MDQEDDGNWGERHGQDVFGQSEDGVGTPFTAWKRKLHEAAEVRRPRRTGAVW